MGRTSSTRAAAIRRAQQAKQLRDARRLERERAIESALADFYEQTDRAEQILAHANGRAARLIADGETAAAQPRRAAALAVARLEDLGETRAAISELTGLGPAAVRDLIATVQTGNSGSEAGTPGADDGGRDTDAVAESDTIGRPATVRARA